MRPEGRELVLYASHCGVAFGERTAEALRAKGWSCGVRPEGPHACAGLPRPWGRLWPGPIVVRDGEAQLRKTDVAFGDWDERLSTIKVKVADPSDDAVHRALALRFVARLEKVMATSDSKAAARAERWKALSSAKPR